MKCTYCGAEFFALFSDICPFCESNNSKSFFGGLFDPLPPEKGKSKKDDYDPYDWENPDNCSDREYEDDDDYDEL